MGSNAQSGYASKTHSAQIPIDQEIGAGIPRLVPRDAEWDCQEIARADFNWGLHRSFERAFGRRLHKHTDPVSPLTPLTFCCVGNESGGRTSVFVLQFAVSLLGGFFVNVLIVNTRPTEERTNANVAFRLLCITDLPRQALSLSLSLSLLLVPYLDSILHVLGI